VQITPFTHFLDNPIWLKDLFQALTALSADERDYKSLQPVEPALTHWLASHLARA
jgi:hypothetical protein